LKEQSLFEFQPITKDTLKEIISNLDHKKACGNNVIIAPFLKLSVHITAGPLVNILNKCILQGPFPTLTKMAVVSPVYKKKGPFKKENYRPISVLTYTCKIFEEAIEYQLSPFLNCIFSKLLRCLQKTFLIQACLNKTNRGVENKSRV